MTKKWMVAMKMFGFHGQMLANFLEVYMLKMCIPEVMVLFYSRKLLARS